MSWVQSLVRELRSDKLLALPPPLPPKKVKDMIVRKSTGTKHKLDREKMKGRNNMKYIMDAEAL